MCVVLLKHLSHTTVNLIGASGAESISRALQSNTSLTSLDISSVSCCLSNFNTQQVTILEILVLRALQEHSNQTLHSNHFIFPVIVYSNTFHTIQITILESLVLRASL